MDNKHFNIFLIGPMGAGKTTIGRQLARKLGMRFLDSDRVIEERTGADIPLIFEKEGEDGFRRREQAIIDELTQEENLVLATGGGAVLNAENRSALAQRGQVIYLHSDLSSLVERTARDRSRPLLQTEQDPRSVLGRILEQREPLYRETADLVIDTSNTSISHVIQAIISQINPLDEKGSEP
jgi:shikimate kinase